MLKPVARAHVTSLSFSVLLKSCTLLCPTFGIFYFCQPHTRPRVSRNKEIKASPRKSKDIASRCNVMVSGTRPTPSVSCHSRRPPARPPAVLQSDRIRMPPHTNLERRRHKPIVRPPCWKSILTSRRIPANQLARLKCKCTQMSSLPNSNRVNLLKHPVRRLRMTSERYSMHSLRRFESETQVAALSQMSIIVRPV